MKRAMCGFTLIEVLVALAIAAIACTAIMKAVSDGILTTMHLRQTTLSRWVAQNVLAELQNGSSALPEAGGSQEGQVSFSGKQWTVKVSASQGATNSYFQQVNIAVGPHNGEAPLYQLKGFVWTYVPKKVASA